MTDTRAPAKQVTLLVVLGLVGLSILLVAALFESAGYLGVALFAGALVVFVVLAALAGFSLEIAFDLVAYAIGVARSAVTRVGKRLGR